MRPRFPFLLVPALFAVVFAAACQTVTPEPELPPEAAAPAPEPAPVEEPPPEPAKHLQAVKQSLAGTRHHD